MKAKIVVIMSVILGIFLISINAPVAQSQHEARGGFIAQVNFTNVTQITEHWQGYYGTISFTYNIYAETIEYPNYFSTDIGARGKIGTIRPLITIIEFLPAWRGGVILVTDSPTASAIDNLRAGELSAIDTITGSDSSDSGSRTFTVNTSFSVSGRTIEAPTAYTFVNSSPSTYFRTGFLMDGNSLVFVVPIEAAHIGYDSGLYNFQFIVPTNISNPKPYYIFFLPIKPPFVAGMRPPPGVTWLTTTWQGKVIITTTATSADGGAKVVIPEGTIAKDFAGNPLSEVRIYKYELELPSIPEGAIFGDVTGVKYAYNFVPDGATFDPPITLFIKFDPADFKDAPPVIYKYKNGEWEALETTVKDNEAFTEVGSFTLFTLFAVKVVPPTPAPTPLPTPTPIPIPTPVVTPTPTPAPPFPVVPLVIVIAIVVAVIIVAVAYVVLLRR